MPLAHLLPDTDPAMEDAERLSTRLGWTRALSGWIAEPLSEGEQIVQAMDDASPVKWHLAHTTWFFEDMVLKPFDPAYQAVDERFSYCFNSYYEQVGPRHPRPKRSLLTRPTNSEVLAYRAHVDQSLLDFLQRDDASGQALALIELGIHHEQQHQELMLTDCL